VGLVSNYLYGPNTLSTEEIHNLTIASYNLKLNPILLIGNIHMPKIIDIIKQVEIKEVCVSNQYKIEDIELLNNSTNSKISISINYENFDYNFFEQIKNNVSSFYYDLNIYRKDVIEKKSLMECENQINQLKSFAKPLYLGGGINISNVKEAIKTISPHGIDISTGLKKSNSVDEEKLKKILDNLGFDEIS
jgi:phosphoribosylanthranilate isomerase